MIFNFWFILGFCIGAVLTFIAIENAGWLVNKAKRQANRLIGFIRTRLGLARVLYISVDGNDKTGTGTREDPWLTVGRAYLGCWPGDTIYLLEGLFPPNGKPIRREGE